jgi:uncharacterized OB-fold protein
MGSPTDAGVGHLFEITSSGRPTLLGSQCRSCRRTDFPARQICLSCGDRDLEQTQLSGRGIVHESTTVMRPPAGFTAKYAVGMVDLEEGPRIFVLLRSECPHGSRVHVVATRLPSGQDGFAFEAESE